MKFLKIILATFIFLGFTSACFADGLPLQGSANKKLDCSAITPTSFSAQLKQTRSYNAPSYNMPHYTNFIQSNPLLNAGMNGMVSSMTMGQGTSSYTPEMQQRQQEEYTRDQIKYSETNDEPEPTAPTQENTPDMGWW